MAKRYFTEFKEYKRLVIFLILMQSVFSLVSQVPFTMTLNPEKPLSDARITVRYILDIENSEYVTAPVPDLPEGLRLLSGPYIRTLRTRQPDRSYINQTQVTYYLSSKEPGIYPVPPVIFTLAGEEQEIPFPDLIILKADEEGNNFPSLARWYSPGTVYYTGQSFPLTLELYNQETLTFPEKIYARFPQTVLTENLKTYGEIKESTYEGTLLYSLPGKSWMITPLSSGTLEIPAARLYAGTLKRFASSLRIEIKDIPEELKKQSGGIGQFSLKTELIQPEEDASSSEIIVHLTLAGEGNFNYLKLPELEYTGMELVEKKRTDNYSPSEKGYKGSVLQIFRFSKSESNPVSLSVAPYLWLDTEEDRIIVKEKKILDITGEAEEPAVFDWGAAFLKPQEIIQYRYKWHISRNCILALLIPAVLIFFAGFFLPLSIRKRTKKHILGLLVLLDLFSFISAAGSYYLPELEKVDVLIQGKEYSQALKEYIRLFPDESVSGVMYNMSLLAGKEKKWNEALFYLRKAGHLDKALPHYQSLSESLSHYLDAPAGQYPFQKIFPSSGLLFSLVMLNILALSFLVFRLRKKGFWLILFLCSMLCTAGASGLYLYILKEDHKSFAFMKEESSLFRLPGTSQPWSRIQAGSDVVILGEQNEYLLIENNFGVQGWILSCNTRKY